MQMSWAHTDFPCRFVDAESVISDQGDSIGELGLSVGTVGEDQRHTKSSKPLGDPIEPLAGESRRSPNGFANLGLGEESSVLAGEGGARNVGLRILFKRASRCSCC